MATRQPPRRSSRAVRRPRGKRSKILPGFKKRARRSQRPTDRREIGDRVPPGEGGAGHSSALGSSFKQSGLGKVPIGTALLLGQQDGSGRHRTSLSRGLRAVLAPGLTFFDLGRPASGLACYALQASLVGWLPGALWAAFARRQLAKKQTQLAARLR
jgi:hypothetical protein